MITSSTSVLIKPQRVPNNLNTTQQVVKLKQKPLRIKNGRGVNGAMKMKAIGSSSDMLSELLEGEDENINLEDLYSQFDSMLDKVPLPQNVGDMVKGIVYNIDDSAAYVDFGGKEIGICSTQDSTVAKVTKATEVFKEDNEYDFEIVATSIKKKALGGLVTYLSRKKIEQRLTRQRLKVFADNDVSIKVLVTGKNRGGYECQITEGLRAFIPATQANINPSSMTLENDELVGKEVEVKVMQVSDEEDGNIILSERLAYLDKNSSDFKVGTVVTGFVTGIKPYGVFIDVNRFQGLLHITQITHVRIPNAEAVFSIGDKIRVMILSYDRTRRRLSLSTKKLEMNPGDMLKDPKMVYEGADLMAAKFREQVAMAEAAIKEEEEKLAAQSNVDFDDE